MGEQIRIVISQGGTGGSALSGENQTKIPNRHFGTDADEEMGKLGFTKKEQMAVAGIVLGATKKTITNSINNYASMTGNYMEATRQQEMIGLAQHMAGVGIGIGMSIATFNPVPAAIAVAGIVINEGINITQKVKEYEIRVSKENYQAERARVRAGTSLADGSRGTNG